MNVKVDDEAAEALEILLVEDDQDDIFLTRKAFEQQKVANNLHVVRDGVDAMAFLRQEDEHADAPRPDIVLLDLNLQTMDGDEVLEAMNEDEHLRTIPVVVLTSSEAEEDIVRSYELNANAYLTKPVDFDGFLDIVDSIDHFWVTFVKLPE
jgi:chemotaxis family two-component system response regulator Rcp1